MAVSKKVEETPLIPEVLDQLPKELVRVFQQYGYRLNKSVQVDQSEEMDGPPTVDLHVATKKYVDDLIATAGLPSGARQFFDQDTPPTGWTKVTTINDRVLRVVSGARADGGSWTISGMSAGNVGGTILSIANLPSHAHTYTRPNTVQQWESGAILRSTVWTVSPGIATSYVGSGTSHAHSGSTITHTPGWRPLHRDVILASKD